MPGESGHSFQFQDVEETTSYTFRIPTEDWQDWRGTLPQTITVYERLHQLIVEDTESKQSDGFEEMEERTARLLATRIQHRSRTALQALDRGNDEAVAEQLENIREISRLFEE